MGLVRSCHRHSGGTFDAVWSGNSLGLGAQQATSGINHVFGLDGGIGTKWSWSPCDLHCGTGRSVSMVVLRCLVMSTWWSLLHCLFSLPSSASTPPLRQFLIQQSVYWVHIPLVSSRSRRWNLDARLTVFYWAWWVFGRHLSVCLSHEYRRSYSTRVHLCSYYHSDGVTLIWMAIFGGIYDQVVNKVGELGQTA